jgi:alpha-glucosidase
MLDVLRFWLDRGVDGFRVDVIWLLIKDKDLRDNPPNPAYRPGIDFPRDSLLPVYNADQPEVFDIIAMMRRVLDTYDERILIGEIYLPLERLVTYYGVGGGGVHLPYNFQLILLPWQARTIAAAIAAYEAALPPDGWPNWVLGNHDQPRVASRVGAAQARVAAMLLLTLRGTPTLYYGDEIGMTNVPIAPELGHDPQGRNLGPAFSRDPERTPMQWDATPNAGFTTSTPWLPVADDYMQVNAALQHDDATSDLTLTRRLTALRRAAPALATGSYTALPAEDDLLAYLRQDAVGRYLIALNLGHQPQTLYTAAASGGQIALSTHLDREGEPTGDTITLRADEGVIVALP